MPRKIVALCGLIVSFFFAPSLAFAGLPPWTGNQTSFEAFIDEMGQITAYRAVAPADPLGVTGFDIGIEATSGTLDGNAVFLPKVKLQKGLPFGLDIAGYYTQIPVPGFQAATGYGLALSYAILDGGAASPALAVRGSYTAMDAPAVATVNTTGLDVTISKGFAIITPYAGVGQIQVSGNDLTGTAPTGTYSTQMTRSFFGANVNLGFMDLAVESDNTGGVQSYSVKAGFRF